MKKTAVIMAHGGVGDFLFQLDLAKRLELAGLPTIFLVRKNYPFLADISKSSDLKNTQLTIASGLWYLPAVFRIWAKAILGQVIIINSFHFTKLRLPTKIFYQVALIVGARIIISPLEPIKDSPYEQVIYKDGEKIWQRNNRLVSQVVGAETVNNFPLVNFNIKANEGSEGYIHIHPVGSRPEKCYPASKLLALLKLLPANQSVLLTMTPREEAWYITPELRSYIEANNQIRLSSKFFSFKDIGGYILGADVFCTVNTGLLWLAIMLNKKVVVCDTYTDYEWNPSPYNNVIRLAHDFNEAGESLHLKLVEHEDGVYYESMYLISPEEIKAALTKKS